MSCGLLVLRRLLKCEMATGNWGQKLGRAWEIKIFLKGFCFILPKYYDSSLKKWGSLKAEASRSDAGDVFTPTPISNVIKAFWIMHISSLLPTLQTSVFTKQNFAHSFSWELWQIPTSSGFENSLHLYWSIAYIYFTCLTTKSSALKLANGRYN